MSIYHIYMCLAVISVTTWALRAKETTNVFFSYCWLKGQHGNYILPITTVWNPPLKHCVLLSFLWICFKLWLFCFEKRFPYVCISLKCILFIHFPFLERNICYLFQVFMLSFLNERIMLVWGMDLFHWDWQRATSKVS